VGEGGRGGARCRAKRRVVDRESDQAVTEAEERKKRRRGERTVEGE